DSTAQADNRKVAATRVCHARRLQAVPRSGQHGGRDEKVAQRFSAILERHDVASQPRQLLEGAGDSAALEECGPGGDGGHGLVRRGGFVRLVQDVSSDREAESASEQRPGRGPVASWWLGCDRWREARAGIVWLQDGCFLSWRRRISLL